MSDKPKGTPMRLLMTRPEPDASLSAQHLRARGHDVIISPALKTSFNTQPLSAPEGTPLFVTSRNAVRALQHAASPKQKATCPLFAVGDATASLAREIGFREIYSASGTVDNLVTLIARDGVTNGIYIGGRERKGDLEGKLRHKNITVTVEERYATDFAGALTHAAIEALKYETIDGILLYSERSAVAFFTLIEQEKISCLPNSVIFFCLAKAITSVFDREDHANVHVATQPNENALFMLIDRWGRERESNG